jgi:hypothetical protein
MRSLPIPLVPLLLVACSSSPTSQPSGLIGKWSLSEGGCTDTYEYRANGTFSGSSGEERLEGRYSVESLAGGKASLKVVRTVESDNKRVDCSGSTKDQTGSQDTRYLVLDGKDKFHVCLSPAGERCFGPLVRQ